MQWGNFFKGKRPKNGRLALAANDCATKKAGYKDRRSGACEEGRIFPKLKQGRPMLGTVWTGGEKKRCAHPKKRYRRGGHGTDEPTTCVSFLQTFPFTTRKEKGTDG